MASSPPTRTRLPRPRRSRPKSHRQALWNVKMPPQLVPLTAIDILGRRFQQSQLLDPRTGCRVHQSCRNPHLARQPIRHARRPYRIPAPKSAICKKMQRRSQSHRRGFQCLTPRYQIARQRVRVRHRPNSRRRRRSKRSDCESECQREGASKFDAQAGQASKPLKSQPGHLVFWIDLKGWFMTFEARLPTVGYARR